MNQKLKLKNYTIMSIATKKEQDNVINMLKGAKITDISHRENGSICIVLDNGKEFDIEPGLFVNTITVYNTEDETEMANADFGDGC